MELKELFHFDPVTLVVLLGGFIATWATLKKDSKWHTSWIKQHDAECKEQRKTNGEILTELRETNSHLATMVVNQEKRLDRVETFVDKVSTI